MRIARGLVAAFVLTGLLSGCGGGGGGIESLPEEQRSPDAGLKSAAKLQGMGPAEAPKTKTKKGR